MTEHAHTGALLAEALSTTFFEVLFWTALVLAFVLAAVLDD